MRKHRAQIFEDLVSLKRFSLKKKKSITVVHAGIVDHSSRFINDRAYLVYLSDLTENGVGGRGKERDRQAACLPSDTAKRQERKLNAFSETVSHS